MNIISVSKSVIFTLLSFCVTSVQGSEPSKSEIPHTFEKDNVISAREMNENFEKIETVVNDLDDSLGSLNDSLGARSQFVGFSAEVVAGDAGIFAMQKECADLSSKSHVCDTSEIMQSTYDTDVNTALPDNGEEWILIDIRSALSQPGMNRKNAPETFSCDGWKTTGAKGATLTAKGEFTVNSCNESNYVACCELKSP